MAKKKSAPDKVVTAKENLQKTTRRKRSKFNNIKFTCDCCKLNWDSEWEHNVWMELLRLQELGRIHDLDRQVNFELHSPYVDNKDQFNLKKICVYRADFTYYMHDGKYVIADAKSTQTAKDSTFRIKWKMVTAEYGQDAKMKIFMKGTPIVL